MVTLTPTSGTHSVPEIFVLTSAPLLFFAALPLLTFDLLSALIFVDLLLFPSILLIRMGMNPMQDDLHDLDKVLASAKDDKTLEEIIRQAEKFLDSQLQAGIAGDQRAITFASVVTAVVAVIVGGLMSAYVSEAGAGILFWALWPACGLLISSIVAAFVARPTDWYYAGSNPRHWRRDIAEGILLKESLAGQAKLYADGIRKNDLILTLNSRLMRWALGISGLSVFAGLVIAILLTVSGTGAAKS